MEKIIQCPSRYPRRPKKADRYTPPEYPGGTTRYLRADRSWAELPVFLPVGIIIQTVGDVNPSTLGMPGTWEEV
jgi:hypothetical protein